MGHLIWTLKRLVDVGSGEMMGVGGLTPAGAEVALGLGLEHGGCQL